MRRLHVLATMLFFVFSTNIFGVEQKPAAVPGQYIIKTKAFLTPQLQQAFLTNSGLTIKKVFRSGAMLVEEASGFQGKSIELLAHDDAIAYIEPNYYYYLDQRVPNDRYFAKLYGLHNDGTSGGTVDADIDAVEAWDISTGSRAIVVGIIDTGVDYSHSDLAANIWHNPGETGLDADGKDKATNGIDDDQNGYIDDYRGWDFFSKDNDASDDHSHGTHCAGTIGGIGDNGEGVAGVNWEVSILPLKVFDRNGSATADGLIEAIEYATQMKVRLTSNSWGGGGFSQAMFDAIQEAERAGILFIAAAGNAGANNDRTEYFPANYPLSNVIAVAATDRHDRLASFSSYGKEKVAVAAPGVDIYSTIPGDGYGLKSGTSMATPHVAGLTALILAAYPNLSSSDVVARVKYSAEPVASLVGRVRYGRINAFSSLENDTVPPSVPTQLVVTPSRVDSFSLQFTGSGDDGDQGKAVHYEARLAATPITTDEEWNKARVVSWESLKEVTDNVWEGLVSGLVLNEEGYVTIRAIDNVGQFSDLSASVAYKPLGVETVFDKVADNMDGVMAEAPWGLEETSFGRVFSDSPGLPHDNDLNTSLILDPIKVADDDLILGVMMEHSLEADIDFGFIEISTDGKQTWREVAALTGMSPMHLDIINLNGSIKAGDELNIRFRLQTDSSVTKEGWKIRQISLYKKS